MPLPWLFLFALLLIPIGVAVFIYSRKHEFVSDENFNIARWISITVFGMGILLLVLSSFTVVNTRHIGVVTTFGRPTDTLSNGIHMKWPWQKVPELDASIQTDTYAGDGGGEGTDSPCTDIRIGNQSTACVDNTIRWRIAEAEGDALYRDYRGMDRIRNSVVTRELNASLNQVLGEFNPLDAVSSGSSEGLPNLGQLAEEVEADMVERVGERIEVDSITIPLIRYDDNTQRRLNEYQAEIANTRIAEQRELTAEAQARANNELSDSVSNAPNVLVSRCLETLADMVEAGQRVPAGFSCWPGGQSAIIVPSESLQGNGS